MRGVRGDTFRVEKAPVSATLRQRARLAKQATEKAAPPTLGYDPFLLLLKAHGFPAPQVEAKKLVPGRQFIADYYFPGPFECDRYRWRGLVVERDGGTWSKKSGHSGGSAYLKDRERDHEMALSGLLVMRFTPQQLDSGAALPLLRRVLA